MNRLTNHFDYCKLIDCKFYDPELRKQDKCKFFDVSIEHCHEKRLNDKLREYEDLEEQGRLLKLPCKVGEKVYSVESNGIKEFIASDFDVCMKSIYAYQGDIFIGEVGFSVFATKAEAEAALERMGE